MDTNESHLGNIKEWPEAEVALGMAFAEFRSDVEHFGHDLEALLIRAQYYDDPPTLEKLTTLHEQLKRILRDHEGQR